MILHALYTAGFFKDAAFHGGTCLRIFYGLPRFSEDLDFSVLAPDSTFSLAPFLPAVQESLRAFGYTFEIQDRSQPAEPIQKAIFKDQSIVKLLRLSHPRLDGAEGAIRIKLEVDIRPPAGATTELKPHFFPLPFAALAHDLPSLFAGKAHALLCRNYTKGRDWYDLLWYAGRRPGLNTTLLSAALEQTGPWAGQRVNATPQWAGGALRQRIGEVDWAAARQDVQRFVPPAEEPALALWSEGFFRAAVEALGL